MTYDNIPGTVIVRYDLVAELASLLDTYRTKREEIEAFLTDGNPFEDSFQINGIAVSRAAVETGLMSELNTMELKLENRFNIVIGKPLPKAASPVVYESAEEAAVEDSIELTPGGTVADLESEASGA